MEEKAMNGVNRYLTLTLGGEFFAIDIFAVREILDYTDITRIPQTPECMRGVVNVRGKAVPVVDLGVKLGLGEVTRTINTRIVIVEIRHDGEVSMMGALADSVKEVLEIDAASIAPPPSLGASVDVASIQGIARHEDRFILLLDVDRVFGTDAVLDIAAALSDREQAFSGEQSAA
ncbi:MAG: chemotaxis protein CheW [Solidesulfovibrio sp.]